MSSPFCDSTSGSEAELVNAKSYLQQSSVNTGDSLYNHLTRVLSKLFDERPGNAADVFEDISLQVKRGRISVNQDNLVDKPDKTAEISLAETQIKLFAKDDASQQEVDEESNPALPNLLEQYYYFEQCGVGLSREETVRVWLALKSLADSLPIETIRFWGKILGTQMNYFVAEVDFRDGEGDEEEPEVEEANDDSAMEKDMDGLEEGEPEVDFIPKPVFKKPPVIPKEDYRSGVNKKTYFVCNEPGQPWIRLPLVTPAQLVTARRIKKFFTGSLDAPVISYPPFPGNEANYLRAQIARISAGTHISPVGYYQFDEDEEEDSSGQRSHVIVNPEFEPLPVRELEDPTNWVHHALHILPQGRTTWWNPVQKSDDDVDNDEDEEEREDQEEVEPEVGPPLLTPLSEDAEMKALSPWSAQISSKLVSQFSVAVVHSCLWPGAHAFCSGRLFENIYVGWGHKYCAENHVTPLLPPAQTEYPFGPEITETLDPTPEEEAALRAETAPDDLALDAADDDDDGLDETNGVEDEGEDDEEDD